jgi:3-isopropylmalate dehydrogenase
MTKETYALALLPGDGIGPEVVGAATEVLDAAARRHGLNFSSVTYRIGAALHRETGEAISADTMQRIGLADAMLLGAAGLPHIRKPDGTELAPQIDIREHYGLFASLRPCKLLSGVPTRLKAADAIDMLLIREITEGLFAGRHDKIGDSNESVSDRMTITRRTSEKLFKLAFEQARLRRRVAGTPGHVTLFDKANVLRSNAFFRKIFDEVALNYPDIATARLYIDAASMMLVTNPERFDVVVTENIFGDITSEIGAGITGGLGVAPSADISESHGLFQPSHGSAPDIAGKNVANPVATILSAAMLLEWLGERNADQRCVSAAAAINAATASVLASGPKTADLGGSATTSEVTAAVKGALQRAAAA